jgi:uncharacterized protein YndB with AHSA1/START domain
MPARNGSEEEGEQVNESGTQVERASDRELVLRRVFQARPRTVFDAMTRPELIRRWWAPRSLGVILHECESDARVGGRYRYVFGRPGEPPMAFSGVYTEVVPGARVVYTQIFEAMRAAGEGLITATYQAHPEGTLLVQRELYPSKEVLDGALASGMERGFRETLEQLAALVPELDTQRPVQEGRR